MSPTGTRKGERYWERQLFIQFLNEKVSWRSYHGTGYGRPMRHIRGYCVPNTTPCGRVFRRKAKTINEVSVEKALVQVDLILDDFLAWLEAHDQ